MTHRLRLLAGVLCMASFWVFCPAQAATYIVTSPSGGITTSDDDVVINYSIMSAGNAIHTEGAPTWITNYGTMRTTGSQAVYNCCGSFNLTNYGLVDGSAGSWAVYDGEGRTDIPDVLNNFGTIQGGEDVPFVVEK